MEVTNYLLSGMILQVTCTCYSIDTGADVPHHFTDKSGRHYREGGRLLEKPCGLVAPRLIPSLWRAKTRRSWLYLHRRKPHGPWVGHGALETSTISPDLRGQRGPPDLGHGQAARGTRKTGGAWTQSHVSRREVKQLTPRLVNGSLRGRFTTTLRWYRSSCSLWVEFNSASPHYPRQSMYSYIICYLHTFG